MGSKKYSLDNYELIYPNLSQHQSSIFDSFLTRNLRVRIQIFKCCSYQNIFVCDTHIIALYTQEYKYQQASILCTFLPSMFSMYSFPQAFSSFSVVRKRVNAKRVCKHTNELQDKMCDYDFSDTFMMKTQVSV